MINIYTVAAFWFLSALLSTIIANRLKISNALMEIIIGAIIGFIAFKMSMADRLSLDADWMKFIAGVAAIMLTFLAGSELNPDSLKSKFKEITIVGLVGFFSPFIGASLIAYFLLDWGLRPSLLTGIALSTTSMAVVYAVMIEYGFNKTSFG
jgi:Kef-type K+ transport system membrane component KefB